MRTAVWLLLGLVAGVMVFELAMRAMMASPWWRVLPAVQAQFDAPDRNLGYAHRPNVEGVWLRENRSYVRMNSHGLRDRERSAQKSSGTLRIAMTGDSITEALQVDQTETFTSRIEQRLRGQGWDAEVLNFGLSGALPLQQLLFVTEKGLPLGIDAAVFVFNAADFLNALMRSDGVLPAYVEDASGNLTIGRGYRERRSHRMSETWARRAFFFLVDHSLAANALYTRVRLARLDSGLAPPRAEVFDACTSLQRRLDQAARLWQRDEPRWAAVRLDRFLADVKAMLGDRPVMFALSGFGAVTPACQEQNELRAQIVNSVRGKLAASGVAFFDVGEEVRKARIRHGSSRLIGFGRGEGAGHLNQYGHEIYAEVLTEAIAARFASLRDRARSAAPPN